MLPLILLIAGTGIAWSAWGFILFQFDPFGGGWIAPALFYISLALALLGSVLLIGIVIHTRLHHRSTSRYAVWIIARQSILFTLFGIILLNLAAHRLLKWWNIIPLALLIFTAELFFLSLQKRQRLRSG